MTIPFFRHSLTADDASRIADVLETPFLTSAQVGKDVEAQLCGFFGCAHAFLTNSWTNGAVATLLALGIGPGDEVIVPASTFIATANVVELVGAKPVFADVDPLTLLLTPDLIAPHLTDRTRAVIPVHLYGRMCDVCAIKAVVAGAPRKIAVIEDAAHSFEAMRDGASPARFSDAAIFSFYATKNITCGEGGAVITNDSTLAARIAQTRLHGMSVSAADRHSAPSYKHWDMQLLGTKANLPDILAALLPPQIATVRNVLETRRRLAQRYTKALAARPDIVLPKTPPGVVDAHHLYTVNVGDARRDRVLKALGQVGIGTGVHYRCVPTMTYYRNKYGYAGADFPNAFAWGEGTLTLPLYPNLREDEQDYVIGRFLMILDETK